MKNIKKVTIILILLLCAVVISPSIASAQQPIKVFVYGQQIQFDVEPVVAEGRIMVPMRALFEALNMNVRWNEDTKTVTAETEYLMCIELTVDQLSAQKYFLDYTNYDFETQTGTIDKENVQEIEMDVPAKIIEGRTMIPLRFVAESMDYPVDWNSEASTVTIGTSLDEIYNPVEEDADFVESETDVVEQEPINEALLDTFSIGDSVMQYGGIVLRFGTVKDIDYSSGQVSVVWNKVTDVSGNALSGANGLLFGVYQTQWVDPSSLSVQ